MFCVFFNGQLLSIGEREVRGLDGLIKDAPLLTYDERMAQFIFPYQPATDPSDHYTVTARRIELIDGIVTESCTLQLKTRDEIYCQELFKLDREYYEVSAAVDDGAELAVAHAARIAAMQTATTAEGLSALVAEAWRE